MVIILLTLQTSPEGQKLFGSSASGSQSQPSGRQRHWTHSLPAEQVESSGEASGSPGGNVLVQLFDGERETGLTVAAGGELRGTTGRGESGGRVGHTDLNMTTFQTL